MQEDKKFTGFTKDHVGEKVTYISKLGNFKGKITQFLQSSAYPVIVELEIGETRIFLTTGHYGTSDKYRTLYLGYNIKVEVTGEEIPEPKLICPACGVEHEIEFDYIGKEKVFEFCCENTCPLYPAYYKSEENAILAMENLIKAMEVK